MIAPMRCARIAVIRRRSRRVRPHVRRQRRGIGRGERDDRAAAAAVGDEGVDVARVRIGRDARLAGERGTAVEIGPQPRAIVDELPAGRLRGVGDRLVGPERAQDAVEARQREARR